MDFNEALAYLFGLAGSGVTQFIKNRYGLNSQGATWAWAIVSVLFACVALLVSGDVALADFTWAAVQPVAGQVLVSSYLAYKLFLKK